MSARDEDPFDSIDADAEDEIDWEARRQQRLDEEDWATYPHREEMSDEEIEANWIQDSMDRYLRRGRPLQNEQKHKTA